MYERHASRPGAFPELAEGLRLALLEIVFDRLLARSIVIGFEERRHDDAQLLDQMVDVPPKLRAHAGRQLEGDGFLGRFEVVDIAPIGRRRLGRRPAFHELADDRVLAGRRRAQGEEVVSGAADADPELEGFDRAVLTHDLRKVLQFRCCLKREAARIRAPAEQFGGQVRQIRHERTLLRSNRWPFHLLLPDLDEARMIQVPQEPPPGHRPEMVCSNHATEGRRGPAAPLRRRLPGRGGVLRRSDGYHRALRGRNDP
jgi:hypothetical protein